MRADDRELIRRLLAGEGAALETLGRWTALAARPYRARLAPEWEDAVQEIQIELLDLLREGAFRGDCSLESFLWRVANHTCLDRLRSRTRRRQDGLDGIGESLVAGGESPVEAALRREENARLWRALAALSPACRELLGWVLDGLSYREMSGRAGVAEGTLRVRVLRCRQRAREALDRSSGGGGVTGDRP